MNRLFFMDVLSKIKHKEQTVSLNSLRIIEESYEMTILLKNLLNELKNKVNTDGFENGEEEIYFFKDVKPQILGKLFFYNKVYRIETACPVRRGKLFLKYFSSQLEHLKQSYKEYVCASEFYRYYRSKRTDMDERYFRLGNVDFHGGLNSIVFEMDLQFSTYYDYKVSRIIADDLLYQYLLLRLNPEDENNDNELGTLDAYCKDLYWTDSKNALIELIYALYVTGAISNGRLGISKMSIVFEVLFRVKLGDLHHSFHRMKDRAGSKTAFLDLLKNNLEKYMNKDL